MVIQHNISAANAERQYSIVTKEKTKSMEKLSSGYRINRAADDAAGLSISEKMRVQIRGLRKGVTNTQDGVSLCQVADGALSEMQSMVHRISELSIQAANCTNTDTDRQMIQDEISQIIDEVDRTSDTTTFNTFKIFGENSGGSVSLRQILCRLLGKMRQQAGCQPALRQW
jgi:flagellin